MTWEHSYPTLAMVNSAAFATLQTWDKSLAAPQTDVERTIRRRITKQLFERAAEEVREKAPHIAAKWNDIMDKLEAITGKTNSPRM